MLTKKFKASVQIWVLKYQIHIYTVFQMLLITTVGIVYPGVETFIVVVLWLNFTIISYLLYLLEIPVLVMAGISLLLLKIFKFMCYGGFLYGGLLCVGVMGFVIVTRILKKIPYVREALESFALNEKILSDHLREMPLIGALVLQVDLCLLLVSYGLLFERSTVYDLINKELLLFLPFSLLWPTTFVFVLVIELVVCVCFNMTYGFKLASQGLILTRQVMGITILGSGMYKGYHEYAVGGLLNPSLSWPWVKSMQITAFGANADSAESVCLLRKFKLLGGSNPPCKLDSTMVDTQAIKVLIRDFLEKERLFEEAQKKNLEEQVLKFKYDSKISAEENHKRFHETLSPPDFTDESAHDKIQVGVIPPDDTFPKKKGGK
jgi:hypothetical protein